MLIILSALCYVIDDGQVQVLQAKPIIGSNIDSSALPSAIPLFDGDYCEIDDETAAALSEIEKNIEEDRHRQMAVDPVDAIVSVESGSMQSTGSYVRSNTPKPQRHKGRVKRASKYNVSPFRRIIVSDDEEFVYQKVMCSCKSKRGSKIKR